MAERQQDKDKAQRSGSLRERLSSGPADEGRVDVSEEESGLLAEEEAERDAESQASEEARDSLSSRDPDQVTLEGTELDAESPAVRPQADVDRERGYAEGQPRPQAQRDRERPQVEGSLEDYREALKWAVDKLSHPGDQMGICDQHGRVPFTHSCANYQNDDFARAVALAEM